MGFLSVLLCLCVKKIVREHCLVLTREKNRGELRPWEKTPGLLGFALGWHLHLNRPVVHPHFVAGATNLAAGIIQPGAVLQAETPRVPWAHYGVVFDVAIRK